MRYIKAAGHRVLESLRWLPRAERGLAASEYWMLPVALMMLIGSGVLLEFGIISAVALRADTLRALHLLGAFMLGVIAAYRIVRGLGLIVRAWFIGNGIRLQFQLLHHNQWITIVRLGWWSLLGLLVLTGAARYAETLGWVLLPFGRPGLWRGLHGVAVPLFYGFGLLVLYARLREQLPALRDYLVRPY